MNTLKTISGINGATFVAPANPAELEDVQKQMAENGMSLLPKGYTGFLSKHNGLTFGEHEFYGTKDIVSKNKEYIERFDKFYKNIKNFVLLGKGDENFYLYTYDTEKKLYEVIGKDLYTIRDFRDFDVLLAYIVPFHN
jgi:hypothetical protein